MRILIAHNHYGDYTMGGEAMVFKQEVELLRQNGFEVKTYEKSNAELNDKNLATKINHVINIHWSKETIREVGEIMDNFKPDILHVHNYKFLITPSIFKAAKDRNIKTVLTLHNYRLMVPCGNFVTKEGNVCELCLDGNPKNILVKRCTEGSLFKSFLQYRLHTKTKNTLNQLVDLVDNYIVLSEFAKEKLIISGVTKSTIIVKPNFINFNPIFNDNNNERAVYIGRLSHGKGLKNLIEQWQCIDYPLSIIGSGPLDQALKIKASENPNIQFLGAMGNKEALEFLQSSAFLIFPSNWYETFGLTIIEAFSVGLPVIASDLGPRSEIITNGSNGFLYNLNESEDFNSKIYQLINDKPLRVQMGKNARDTYHAKYSPKINFKLLSNLYRNLK